MRIASSQRMPSDEHDNAGISERILEYLNDHPDAADAVDGIRQWWLPRGAERSTADVQAALDTLVERGLIARIERPGTPPVYRRAPRPGGRPRAT